MSVKVEIGSGWICTIMGESFKQAPAPKYKQPIILRDIASARCVQLWQGVAVVNLYLEEAIVKVEAWNWNKAQNPTNSSGLVIKWDKFLIRRGANELRRHSYCLIGEFAAIEFGDLEDTDYLKVVNQSLDRAILVSS